MSKTGDMKKNFFQNVSGYAEQLSQWQTWFKNQEVPKNGWSETDGKMSTINDIIRKNVTSREENLFWIPIQGSP